MKKIWLAYYFIVGIYFVLFNSVYGQSAKNDSAKLEDVLYLKNGDIYRGRLITAQDADTLRIQIYGGSVLSTLRSECKSITQEEPLEEFYSPKKQKIKKQDGMYVQTSFGILVAGSNTTTYSGAAFHVQGSIGYRLHSMLGLGLGTGISLYDPFTIIPVFGELRGEIGSQNMAPHYYVQAGYGIPGSSGDDGFANGENLNERGKLYLDIGMGVRLFTKSKISWLISLGYQYQGMEMDYTDWADRMIERDMTLKRIALRLGWLF